MSICSSVLFMFGNENKLKLENLKLEMICNKILGKVTKFGEKRTKTLGVANRFMV